MPGKMIACGDCGDMFEWSEKDQDFYASKDFLPPKRCKSCRDKRKKRFAENEARKGGRGGQGSRGRSRQPVRSGNR